jgi:hypothetical protein
VQGQRPPTQTFVDRDGVTGSCALAGSSVTLVRSVSSELRERGREGMGPGWLVERPTAQQTAAPLIDCFVRLAGA